MPATYLNAAGTLLSVGETYGRGSVGTAKSTLSGTTGNDGLRTGGNSTLTGGLGDDTYFVYTQNDVVVENDREGIDTVVSTSKYYTLPNGTENLTLAGNNSSGAGNHVDNIISAPGTGSHTLNGGAGNDVLIGGSGVDTFVVTKGEGSDVVIGFDAAKDFLQLQSYSSLTSFAKVKSAMSQVGADTVIRLETGETLTLRDHKVEDLSAANFRLPVDMSKYQLTFSDEFNTFSGSATGVATTWQTKYPQAGLRTLPSNKEDEYYSDSSVGVNPFSVKDGVLDITAARATQGVETPLGSGLDWTSGVITSYKSFSQLYGYFEVRAQLPAGKGFWPAFWLLPADLSWPPELDVFEVLGDEPGTIYASTHSKVGGPNVTETQTVFGIDTSKGFHTYGVDWQADTITYYVDNNAVARLATPSDMNKPMYMLLNLAVGDAGSWPGATDATTPAEGHMLIDSVRAYARNPGVVADIQDASPVPGGHDPGGSNASVQAATPSQGLASTSGVPAAEGSHVTAVYRFFDTRTGDHFYTNSTAEKAQILQTLPWFTYEGTPWATPTPGADTIDVFRFFDTGTTSHFFTTSVGERDQIIKTNPSYKYEGVAFEAYADAGAPGTVTLERFFNTKTGQHHFAGNAEETAGINQGAAGPGWIDEGKGFTVHAPGDGMLFA